jgi:hypothetical protein
MPVYSHMVVQISTYMQVGERGLVELVGLGRLLGRSRPEVCPIAAAFRGELFKVLPHDRSAYTFLQLQSMVVKILDHPDQYDSFDSSLW